MTSEERTQKWRIIFDGIAKKNRALGFLDAVEQFQKAGIDLPLEVASIGGRLMADGIAAEWEMKDALQSLIAEGPENLSDMIPTEWS